METEAFGRIMQRWKTDPSFTVTELTTDKNRSILSKVQKEYPDVTHGIDKWHVIKNIKKSHSKVYKLKIFFNLSQIGTRSEEERKAQSHIP